ncbi:MAG: hypothetical protein ABR518_07575 [Actinomycetota bacterium]
MAFALTALLVASALSYLGIAVSLAMIGANSDFGAYSAAVFYWLIAVGLPVALAVYWSRYRSWHWRDAARTAAIVSVGVNLVFAPIGLGVMVA